MEESSSISLHQTAPTSSSFFNHRSSTFARGNAAAFGYGSMAVPPAKKTKFSFSKKTLPVLKSITLTDINENGAMEDITDARINLTALSERDPNFGPFEVSMEVPKQIHHDGTLIILYKSGIPVKDSITKRGIDQWNNKMGFRAMDSNIFKVFKPQAWKYVKTDYLLDDEEELPHIDELFPGFQHLEDMAMNLTGASTNASQISTYTAPNFSSNVIESITTLMSTL